MAYDVQKDDIAAVRTHLFLRSIVIDSDPLEDLIEMALESSDKEQRSVSSCTNYAVSNTC